MIWILLLLLPVFGAESGLATQPCVKAVRLYSVSLGENSWEDDIRYLDHLSNELYQRTQLRSNIILYNGRRFRRDELNVRMTHLPDYMWNWKGIPRDRVTFWFGGYRETTTMEIWLLEPGSCPVPATPTIPSSEAILVPGRYVYAIS
jgi:hypothetical protein